MRISSLCPAGTEIVFAVGAGDDVVGVSHACDFPPEARDREVVTKPRFDPSELSSHQIYNEKLEAVRAFGSVFRLDESTLCGLRSDVVITPGPGELPLVALDDVRTQLFQPTNHLVGPPVLKHAVSSTEQFIDVTHQLQCLIEAQDLLHPFLAAYQVEKSLHITLARASTPVAVDQRFVAGSRNMP